MNKETLKALKASIKHWQIDPAPMWATDCALCIRFPYNCGKDITRTAEICPVSKQTERMHCGGTPYTSEPTIIERRAEIKFLQSLLP